MLKFMLKTCQEEFKQFETCLNLDNKNLHALKHVTNTCHGGKK
jgi:hypothetical protein